MKEFHTLIQVITLDLYNNIILSSDLAMINKKKERTILLRTLEL